MRVISQDGAIDAPYELSTITVDGNKIGLIFNSDTCWQLAVYRNAEEAQKQVGKLHNMFMQMTKTLKNGEKVSYENFPKVFRFPPDSEMLEV